MDSLKNHSPQQMNLKELKYLIADMPDENSDGSI